MLCQTHYMGGGQNIGNLLIGQVFPSNLVYFDGISLNRLNCLEYVRFCVGGFLVLLKPFNWVVPFALGAGHTIKNRLVLIEVASFVYWTFYLALLLGLRDLFDQFYKFRAEIQIKEVDTNNYKFTNTTLK